MFSLMQDCNKVRDPIETEVYDKDTKGNMVAR